MADDKVKTDVIVVGAGPAGSSAAYTLANAGLGVILVERGEYAGSKSVGGLLYATSLQKLIPDCATRAPIERPVSKRGLMFLGNDEHFEFTFGSDVWSRPPFNNTYIVYRSQFDKWFSKEAETAGANLVEGMVVDDLVYEGNGADKRVTGVKIRGGGGGDEVFYADCVILADGANPIVTRRASVELKMKGGRVNQDYAIGVKEIIRLPRGVIEDRFQLEPTEGAAFDFFGVPFEGLVGGAFIYTAGECLHVGIAARLQAVLHSGLTPNEVMDKFLRHPTIRKYVRGGELAEYSAHLIPEGGYDAVPQLVDNGLMIAGDAAGFVNMSLYKEGTNHAMESGRLAAETAIEAKAKKDFSKAALSAYETKLKACNVMKDLKTYRHTAEVMEKTPHLFSLYPRKVARLITDYFAVSDLTKSATQRRAVTGFLKGLPKLQLIRDGLRSRHLC